MGVEMCRLACGGHGYMTCANFSATYGLVTAMCTYEGENTVLLLQTARFLMKAWQSLRENQKMTPTVKYLENAKISKKFAKTNAWIIEAIQKVAAG